MTLPADFSKLRFRHPWRSYQARLLSEMEHHLADDKLHFVAAPGAGKTVLGLEIIRRLGHRTLILAPSLLVRDQWITRLVDDFLDGQQPDWISTDLTSDAPVRVSTYQNVHTSRTKKLPPFDLLCLDEAHHLRRAWWKTLTRLARVNRPVTLSLTATPPYDAQAVEWRNYMALCGPVDAEISVPELVLSGDLCPHQDLVYLAGAADVQAYYDSLHNEQMLFDALSSDRDILASLQGDPWIVDTEIHAHAILENPARFSAMLIYLRHNHCAIPVYARRVLQVNDADWPALDWRWLLILFRAFPQDELPKDLLRRLKSSRALRNDTLTLPPAAFSDRLGLLRNDQALLKAIRTIYSIERVARGKDLRMAILLDRIGKSNVRLAGAMPEFNTLGVFQHLRQTDRHANLAVLTGQLAILPKRLSKGLDARPMIDEPDYVSVIGTQISEAVARVNRAFTRGDVQVIIGTQAFLGQGWDAPALNALVLGTRLKSFVAVNQLRGRALRIFRNAPEKTSHIWHMAMVPKSKVEGEDIERLQRRFDCFVRLDRAVGVIHSSFDLQGTVNAQNTLAEQQARSHDQLGQEWQTALVSRGDFEAKLATRTSLPWHRKLQALPVPALSIWARLGAAFGRPPPVSQTRRVILRMAKMIVASLSDLGDLPPVTHDLSPIVTWDGKSWQVGLNTDCKLDEAIFHETFQQLFSSVLSPRYVICVKSGLVHANFQYFSVPDRFGSNKERATLYWRNWQAFLGRGRLVYTRTVQGRATLQAARLSTAGFSTKTNTKWQ
ncbi:DEAD/DEAH box helicase family protein [Pelagimonas varians]|uniref:Type III restriction enzyme, res subunit n=1 Tax=Pelagimonas varians TaxID=696760 RepID=A0A238K6K4_9RHOB|nr:DEAD/DEAH box helicase family protein [Pelagimonas varians]PYG31912.1 type III restriction/modification enzyme restriction subunit [Pelagimonas varians]SMX38445.1 Type III restriction enzyme, res subunit [Pelagimonas varians]